MENGNSKWIEERLNALGEGARFDAARGRALLEQRQPGASRRWTWAAVAAAACVVVAVLPAAGRVWDRLFVLQTAEVLPLPAAADFALADADGKTVRLSDYKGQVVLLNFWATWCLPCQHEVPWFVDFQARFQESGFAVLGVSLDEEGWEPVRAFMAEKQVNYPVMLAKPGELPAPYNAIGALPKTFLIDREGKVAGVYEGLASQLAYEKWIRSVLDR